jgi:hypothetical protein
MLTIEQLRRDNPELNQLTDEELDRWYMRVREWALLMIHWWIETEGGSKSVNGGVLSGEDEME